MKSIVSRFRVSSSASVRPFEKEREKVLPNCIYFLSVEGDLTERDYFTHLEAYISTEYPGAGIRINVQTPRHSGLSSPESVYELLEQCADIRTPKLKLKEFSKSFQRKYGCEIDRYFGKRPSVTKKELAAFRADLEVLGIRYDVVNTMRCFGVSEVGAHPDDRFGMVIDRDRLSRTKPEQLSDIWNDCKKKKFGFYISNPCFELWLYLHKVDVAKKVSAGDKEKMRRNLKQNEETYMAKRVKKVCHHSKNISQIEFQRHYKNRLYSAIEHAKGLETHMPGLLNKLGTNVGLLVEEILSRCEKTRT